MFVCFFVITNGVRGITRSFIHGHTSSLLMSRAPVLMTDCPSDAPRLFLVGQYVGDHVQLWSINTSGSYHFSVELLSSELADFISILTWLLTFAEDELSQIWYNFLAFYLKWNVNNWLQCEKCIAFFNHSWLCLVCFCCNSFWYISE